MHGTSGVRMLVVKNDEKIHLAFWIAMILAMVALIVVLLKL